VVECPNCGSKFKINKDVLPKEAVKMRCSVCSHIFSYSLPESTDLEQDFDELLKGTNEGELEEKPLEMSTPLERREEITESAEQIKPEGETGEKSSEEEVQPESVIREIDSILGSGDAVTAAEEVLVLEKVPGKGISLKLKVTLAILALLIIGAGLWFMKDYFPSLKMSLGGLGQPITERGPFFSIPDDSVTYEMLTNNSEGSVLVVKGIIKKLTAKPLRSVMIEARVYDQRNNLIESRSAYAGIVPESSELMQQNSSDIETLLTAEPRSLGALATSSDIPFAVAFFGKSARDGYSIQVEVKEFHWK
jgi:predicted Zn finger-like uncharacterized protein